MRVPKSLRNLSGLGALALIGFGLFSGDEVSDGRWLAILGTAWILLLTGMHMDMPVNLPTFNRGLIRTSLVIVSVFILISAQLVRIQVVQSDATYNRTSQAPDGEVISNPRASNTNLNVSRGRIFDREGVLIADTVGDDGQFLRTYPDPATAYVAGYFSPLLYGSAGLELSWNDELSGRSRQSSIDGWLNGLLGRAQEGLDLNLTLDAELQKTGTDLLAGRTGSVVIMDAETGAILTLVSAPTYDPNQLFTAQSSDNDNATDYWEQLVANPDSPLLLRSTMGLYTPGSTFKTITAAAALERNIADPDSVYEDNGSIVIDGRELVENNRPDDNKDQWTLEEGVGWSLNVVLAQVGLQIGADGFWESATFFGIGEDVPFDLQVAQGQIAGDRDFLDSQNALADTAFGQGELLVSPIQMVMVAACFNNGGQMMQPYLVETVASKDGEVVETTSPEVWRTPVSESTANDVREMMIFAVEEGSIQRAAGTGYEVGGKTGTAETGDGGVNSWYIGFIGDGTSRYSVAVVLEDDSSGLGTAVDIGTQMLVETIDNSLNN
ncbi:MAG: penicillin-binding protein 2 [Thermomicrobiales bacterium]